MTVTISARFRLRRDTAANWTATNPVLLLGEPGVETDTRKMKFGDGSTAWNSLSYMQAPMTAAAILAALLTVDGTGSLLDADLLDGANLDTDVALAANSDTRIASQKATKAYVDGLLAAQDAMVFKGVIDCSANPNYPAADRGHTYRVSVAGKIGGGSGPNVEAGDILLCLTDGTAAGTHAAVGANWAIIQANIDGAVIGPSSAVDAAIAGFSGTSGKLIKQLSSAEVRAAASFTSATSKATPVDADELPLVDSAASFVVKKLTWANLKATLKTYFDTVYQALNSNLTTIAGLTATTDNFIVSVSNAWASRTPAQVRATLGFGSTAYTTGTSFPGSPASGDKCYRTDRATEYYYDGTRWLSTQLFTLNFSPTDFFIPITTSKSAGFRTPNPWAGLYDIYMLDVIYARFITGSSSWTYAINKSNSSSTAAIAGSSTTYAADTINIWNSNRVAVNVVVTNDYREFDGAATLNSGAASNYLLFAFTYRLVG